MIRLLVYIPIAFLIVLLHPVAAVFYTACRAAAIIWVCITVFTRLLIFMEKYKRVLGKDIWRFN